MLIPHVAMPTHFIDGKPAETELPVVEARDHYVSWADACRGEDKTTSHFDYASPLHFEEEFDVVRVGLEESVRPLVEARLADLGRLARESPPPAPPDA